MSLRHVWSKSRSIVISPFRRRLHVSPPQIVGLLVANSPPCDIANTTSQVDGRDRLSNLWAPTGLSNQQNASSSEDVGHDLLIRAGFLRQAHSGIFHLLPLGLRVQNKIESLIDKHMGNLGASKVSLSSLSPQALWAKSGRLDGRDSEFFKLLDRKKTKFLLAPTHEEEITTIVANAVRSYKDLPLRLYQVSRKYRDEARPRQGLLRGREFIMKDLYTFDSTDESALKTYEAVQAAYRGFFDDLGIPYLVASADSGKMGGNYSHEYHLASTKGEDTIISCSECDYSINEELYREPIDGDSVSGIQRDQSYRVVHGLGRKAATSKAGPPTITSTEGTRAPDELVLVSIFTPQELSGLNRHALKEIVPELDLAVQLSESIPEAFASRQNTEVIAVFDPRVDESIVSTKFSDWSGPTSIRTVETCGLSQANAADACPACKAGSLQLNQAIEVGHTFHLGTRYSKPLGAKVLNANNKEVDMAMGCHGVGVSRLMGAAASLNADKKGLNWPIVIAPFTIVVMSTDKVPSTDVHTVYDNIIQGSGAKLDAIIDDREKPLGWRLKDADLVGYPFIVVLGKSWAQDRHVEVQCRVLNLCENVALQDLRKFLERHYDTLRQSARRATRNEATPA
jgi:prolyl-tRNA synthetase